MGKKGQKIQQKRPWKTIDEDFRNSQLLNKDSPVFAEISDEEFTNEFFLPALKNGEGVLQVLQTLVNLEMYLKPRSEHLHSALQTAISDFFSDICITLPKPFDELTWQDLEATEAEDLNKKEIMFNGIPTTPPALGRNFKKFIETLKIQVRSVEVFSFEIDSYGCPPINCKKIWHPLLWLRMEIEKQVKELCPDAKNLLVPLVTNLNMAPKEGNLEKMTIASFFLEKTADNLDYENTENFWKNLKSKFGSLKIDQLQMVLPDILIAHSEELAERVMQVSYFIPLELLRLMFECWRPKILKLRLRTEACSLEEASRIEWDDEDKFQSVTLYNSTLFDRCEPVPMGSEDYITDCVLYVEASGSRLFDPVHNEKNVDTAGRDFLTIFKMKNVLIRRTVPLNKTNSVKAQIKQNLKFLLETFFAHPNEHSERELNVELCFENSEDVQMSIIRKCIGEITKTAKYGVDFKADSSIFDKFNIKDGFASNSSKCRSLTVSFFDAENQFILDLLVVLTARSSQ